MTDDKEIGRDISEEDAKQLADAVVRHWRDRAERMTELINSGYAGIQPNGQIVDRREYPSAIPIQKNTLLGVPEPKGEAGEGEK